jgi:raffinose/stachyose/melibiose transport system substrate-binding protein
LFVIQGEDQMKKVLRFAIPVLFVCSMLLSACATAAPTATATEAPAATATSAPVSTEAATVAPTQEPITLTYWADVPTQSQFELVYKRWQELHPNITIEFQQFQDSSEYSQKLSTSLAAGEGPDMFMVFKNDVDKFGTYAENIEPYAKANWGDNWQDSYIPVAIPSATMTDGTIIGVPIGVESQEYVLYNKALTDSLGITTMPKTYAELKTMVQTIKDKGNGLIPIALGAKDKWHISGFYIYLANQFGPGKVYQAEAGKIKWDDPDLLAAMKAWKQMFDDKIFQDGAVGLATYPDARDQYYYSRKSVMFMTGSWHVGSYALPPNGEKIGTSIEKDPTDAFPFPQVGPYPAIPTAQVSWIFSINNSITDQAKKDAAYAFFDFFVKGEGAQIMADTLQASPVLKGIKITTINNLPFQSDRDSVNMLIDELGQAQGNMRFSYTELEDAVGTAMQEVATGSKTPEQAMQEIQAASDQLQR